MREKLKSLLLVALCISTVVLLMINLSLGIEDEQLSTSLGFYESYNADAQTSGSTVRPAKIAVGGAGGLYLASGGEASAMWSSVSPILSEALGSVTKITAIDREEFLARLNGYSIYTGFTFSVPFHMLQFWWTGEQGLSSVQAASNMALVEDDGRVSLVFCDSDKGEYYSADTAAGYDRFVEFCMSYSESNAFFAGQRDGYQMFVPYEPVWAEGAWFPVYSVSLPEYSEDGSVDEELLSAFGFNPFLAETYFTTNGDIVYVEGYKALSFSSEGRVIYSSNGGSGIPIEGYSMLSGKAAEAHAVTAAANVLTRICSAASCPAELSVAGIDENNGKTVIVFERIEDGVMVTESDGYTAVVTVENGSITAIRLQLGSMSKLSESMLLPLDLASALIDGSGNELFVRCQVDGDTAVPELCWRRGGVR